MMDTWLLIIAIFLSAYFVVAAINKVSAATHVRRPEPAEQHLQPEIVRKIAATLIAGYLANPRDSERLEKLRQARTDLVGGQIREVLRGEGEAKKDSYGKEELKKEIEEAINNADPFKWECRKRFMKLAWDIYSEVELIKPR